MVIEQHPVIGDSEKKYKVVRLANAPAAEPYRVETRWFATYDGVDQQVGVWWSSRGTLALVVLKDKREDSRYERDWIDQSRVPDGWESRRKGTKAADILAKITEEQLTSPSTAEDVSVTIFNEDEPAKRRVVPAQSANVCHECLRPLPNEPYPGDEERTPSGRHNAGRCGTCGHSERGMSRRNLLLRHIHRSCKRPQPETSQPSFSNVKRR